jgi:signal transduction histidine kinase
MQTQDRVIGVLEVYGRSLAGPAMSEALSSLADQGACALDRSRVYGDMVAQERRVKQVVRRLVLAQEHERRRVAFEVHDGLAQLTVAAHHYLEAFASGYRTRNRDRSDQLEHARDLLRRTVCEARRLIGGLLPTLVNEVGLAAAVQFEVEGLRADGWHVEYIANIGPDRLAAATELALFRVAQEALANVRKHAGQSKVRVTLERRGHAIHLEVRDWGRGFRQTRSHNSHDPSERIGLVGMRERVSLIGGRSSIRSRPGCGTRVTVDVQLPPTIQILRAAAEPGPHA